MLVASSLHIIFASTSGHTEYVVQVLAEHLQSTKHPSAELGTGSARSTKRLDVTMVRVEQATPDDLHKGDVLVLASGSWNTGGREGQLNPHMHEFLLKCAKDVNLKGKKVALIALGDDRYRYTANALTHLRAFVADHDGVAIDPPLKIVNEPYGQEEVVREWGRRLVLQLR